MRLKRLLLLYLLIPFQFLKADFVEEQSIQDHDSDRVVYVTPTIRNALSYLHASLPHHHPWSDDYINAMKRIAHDGIALPYDIAHTVVNECLELLQSNDTQDMPVLRSLRLYLEEYATDLKRGNVDLLLINENGLIRRASCCSLNDNCINYKSAKAYCALFTREL